MCFTRKERKEIYNMADYQEIRDKMKEENCKRKEEERRNKPKLGLTEEED